MLVGSNYEDGLWVSQGDPTKVNEQFLADPTQSASAGAVRQFVQGQLGKEINLPNPTNSGALVSNRVYKYVQRYASDAAQNTPNTLVGWQDTTNFVVQTAGATRVPAGVSFCDDDASSTLDRGVQVGNFGYIQVAGVATVRSSAAVTAGVPVADNGDGRVKAAAAATDKVIGFAVTAAGGADVAFDILLELPRLSR